MGNSSISLLLVRFSNLANVNLIVNFTIKRFFLDMPNGGKNENSIETLDADKQATKKLAVLFLFRDVGSDKHDAVC